MATKRSATTDLNHENWDVDDDREDSGTFQRASENVLANRVIRKAFRRGASSSPVPNTTGDGDQKNVFGSFSFNKPQTSSNFDFTKQENSVSVQPKTNGLGSSSFKSNSHSSTSIFGNAYVLNKTDNSNDKYYAKLKGLNETVLEWIKKHVDANPLIDLTPVFQDYEKYLKDLNSLKYLSALPRNPLNAGPSDNLSSLMFKAPTNITGSATESSDQTNETNSSTEKITAPFTFGMPQKPGTIFNMNAGPSTSNFMSTPTMFGNANICKETTESKEEDNEDEPPKAVVKEVDEDGHIFKMRCKVFVKKDNAYSDRGVGNLFLKPIPNSSKVQVIVRADTNLGNVLCNFVLSESIPVQKKGAKDVLLVCLPTPDFSAPCPLLLRVKSSEDSEQLFQELQKHQK